MANELDQFNFSQSGNLSPEMYAQQQQLNRQQQLASMLMQNNQQPTGQMISGRYVAPSFLQALQPAASMITGAYLAKRGDTKTAELAQQLRGQQEQDITKFGELLKTDPSAAYQFASRSYVPQLREAGLKKMMPQEFDLAEGANRYQTLPDGTTRVIASGNSKLHSVDGNLVDSKGNLVFKAPKIFAPHASQLVPVAGGFAEYNPNTKTLVPIGGAQGGASGAPSGALMPPLPANIQKEIIETNQQTSIINDAIKGVEGNRQYFGGKYAAPELLGGEIGQSVMNRKLPEGAVEARSNVFNTASAVIKERAGTAQTPSEKTIIMRFLPSIYDNDATVIKKLNAYNKYIGSKAAGTTAVPNAIPTYQGQPKQNFVANPAAVVAPPAAPIYATNGKTRIMSTDGGNTWQPAGGQ